MVNYVTSSKPSESECSDSCSPDADVIPLADLAERDGYDPLHEAAFFYGLYLRGEPIEQIRSDIGMPEALLAKWATDDYIDDHFRRYLYDVYAYRRSVLTIFEKLVAGEQRFALQ